MNIRNYCFVYTLALVFSSHVFANEGSHKEHAYGHEDFFSIDMPFQFTINRIVRGEEMDFEIFEVKKFKQRYIGIYVGNHPNRPINDVNNGENISTQIIDGDEFRIFSISHEDAIIAKEVLIEIHGVFWPCFIHAWVNFNLPVNEILVAENILMSLRVKMSDRLKSKNNEDMKLLNFINAYDNACEIAWSEIGEAVDDYHINFVEMENYFLLVLFRHDGNKKIIFIIDKENQSVYSKIEHEREKSSVDWTE